MNDEENRFNLMHLSMLSPRVGGRADPGDFDIFIEARVKFPTPGHLVNVKFPHPSGKCSCKRHVLEPNSRPRGSTQVSKSLPRGKLSESKSRG